jgi:chromosome segregation protein
VKIKRLEISGFKSFADRTVFHFDDAITGVVGPNGCGKSNVVDAIRWAMGEQSAKHLRGREMYDVIFAGSESREPTSMAEVTIVFDNQDGLAAPELAAYPEVAVTRRLFRTGESEYLLNKTPSRLRDITELFLGTGVGTKAYSIVEQGRIGLIVSSRPEDRRHLIEEAAGITKYQSRKKAAERKMEQTRQNLLRVSDIVAEIQKNLNSLKYQAAKARRYKEYKAEIRDIDLHIASHRYLELVATGKAVESQWTERAAEEQDLAAALDRDETEIEARRVEVTGLDSEHEQRQLRGYELDNRVRLAESDLQHLRQDLEALAARERDAEAEIHALGDSARSLEDERARLAAELASLQESAGREETRLSEADLLYQETRAAEAAIESRNDAWKRAESGAAARIAAAGSALKSLDRRCQEAEERLERVRTEREDLESRMVELEAEIGAHEAHLGELRDQRSSLGMQKQEAESRLAVLKVELGPAERALDAAKEELGRKRSRLHALGDMLARLDGASRGARALLQGADEGFRVVADVFDVAPELEGPMAAVLGARVQHVVVPGVGEGIEAVRRLVARDLGRANLIPESPRRVVRPAASLPEGPGVLGYLVDLVRFAPADEPLARLLLGDTLLVEDLDSALAVWQRGTDGRDLVTRDGALLEASGAMAGGGREEAAEGLLHAKHEVRELAVQVEVLEVEHGARAAIVAALRTELQDVTTALEALRQDVHQGDLRLLTEEQAHRRSEEDRARTTTRIDGLSREACDIAGTMAEAARELEATRSEALRAQAEQAELASLLEEGGRELEAARAATQARASEVTECKVRAAAALEKAEGVRGACTRVDQTLDEVRQREERLVEEVARGAAKQSELATKLVRTREELAELVVQAEAAQAAVAEARAACEAARLALGEREAALKTVRGRLEEVRRDVSRLEVSRREQEVNVQHLLEQVDDRHRLNLARVVGDYHLRDLPDDTMRDRLAELQRLVERMGEINLTAIQELEEQSRRLEHLSSQKEDIEKALTQLEAAITQMNRESKKLFRETFEAVNERFQALFPRLFRGGRARLELTNPDDLLETGVDIFAQPPGKKLSSIELMSGGEKAMTAVALIFAMFQVRPSPFCLLDEVDAPLDEANVGRFVDMIRDMTDRSQFILITHSKRTMEKADSLYGVTMQEPGISKLVAVKIREVQTAAAA